MALMHLEVVTAERTVFAGDVNSIVASSVEGKIGILPGHASLVSLLQPGELSIKSGGDERLLFVSGGFLQVFDDEVVILADACEYAEEIDIERAEAARQRAQDMLEAGGYDIDAAAAEAALRRSLARLRVANHRRRAGIDNLPRFSV